MSFTYSFKTDSPVGSDVPSSLDEFIREDVKLALQERLNVDHVFTIDSHTVDAVNTGKHAQITFAEAIEVEPTPEDDQAVLYIADATNGESNDDELHFKSKASDEVVQITDNNRLYIKVDGTTIENDSSNGLQMTIPEIPTTGGDLFPDNIGHAVVVTLLYEGDGDTNRTIHVGEDLIIRSATIMRVTSGGGHPLVFLSNTPQSIKTRGVQDGGDKTGEVIIDSDNIVKLIGSGVSSSNASGSYFYLTAICERA